ncbi:hypothetical protein WR25_01606 [Diploscapter pachys]|uniref:Uncharacterized protein n=1 Tax=Diploscapter pachys TaxID=2018661 RepID=A0A2A2K4Z5_9BILA|nr:hypothetical protein WR25_01606 [Diploscapter pachys]
MRITVSSSQALRFCLMHTPSTVASRMRAGMARPLASKKASLASSSTRSISRRLNIALIRVSSSTCCHGLGCPVRQATASQCAWHRAPPRRSRPSAAPAFARHLQGAPGNRCWPWQ